jgi:hypothetical protein
MRCIYRDENGEYHVRAGSHIPGAIREAIALSAEEDMVITVELNDVKVNLQSDSDFELIYRDWSRALSGYIEPNVGPHPNPVLTDEEKANDNRIEAENERRRQAWQAEFEAQATAERNAVEARLVNVPQIEVADENAWQKVKNKKRDPYIGAIINYAERWARLMQVEMANGKHLEEVAEATSHEADFESITGNMYGGAVGILAQFWKYGDQLRRWHNLDTQLGSEGEQANQSGGVLNPAIISIS